MDYVKEKLEVLECLPVVVCLLNIADKKVLYANKSARIVLGDNIVDQFFLNVFESSRDLEDAIEKAHNGTNNDSVKSFAQLKNGKRLILFFNEYTMEMKNDTVSTLMVTAVDITTIRRDSSFVSKDKNDAFDIYNKSVGLDFLNGCLHDVESGEVSYFSVAYICIPDTEGLVKENDDLAKREHIKELVTVIKNSIRATDMLCSIEDTEFLMIFPKCKCGIMSNILTAIENKLEIINDTNDRKNKLKINYAVLEISKENIDSPEKIIKRVRDTVVTGIVGSSPYDEILNTNVEIKA